MCSIEIENRSALISWEHIWADEKEEEEEEDNGDYVGFVSDIVASF